MLRCGRQSLGRVRLLHTQLPFEPDKRWPEWQVVVGIETHAQIKSRRKLFSNSLTSDLGESPNVHVSAYDASFPGTLPRLNPKCADLAIRTALALESQIQLRSAFDRKHYFYADLPLGYQITQHYAPIALGGRLELPRRRTSVRIKQVQLEQDTAKSIFNPESRESHIDLNRAGIGLLEIVSEPDIHSPEEARDYVKALQALLRSIGSSDGNMEQGSLRCDVNVSVNRPTEPLGTRCEIKNLNSIKSLTTAIAAEVYRQTDLLSSGCVVPQETRGFDEHTCQTFRLRSKEDSPDYRYMPDPNLPPLILTKEYISSVRNTMPELPPTTRARLLSQGLSDRDVDVVTSVDAGDQVPYDGEPKTNGALVFFDKVAQGRDPKIVANWMTHELLGQLSANNRSFSDNPVSVDQMGELIDMVQKGSITGTSGKFLLRHLFKTCSKTSIAELASEYLHLSSQAPSLDLPALCREVVRDFPEEATKVRKSSGDAPVLNKLIGAVIKRTRGKVEAKAAKQALVSVIMDGDS